MQTEDARAGRRPSVLPEAKALRIGLGDLGLNLEPRARERAPSHTCRCHGFSSVSADVNGDAL